MPYYVWAWLTSISYGIGSVVGKIATKHHITNPWLYNFVWSVLTLVSILPFALINHVGWPADWPSMLWLGLADAASGTAFILAFSSVDLTIMGPLYNLRTPLIVLSGVLFFRETLAVGQWAYMGLVVLAGLFVSLDERMKLTSFWNKGTLLVGIAALTSAWFNTMVKQASLHNGFWEVSLWSAVLTLLFILPTWPLFSRDLQRTRFSRYWGVAVLTVLYTLGLLFSFKALATNVSISIVIISLPLSMIITIALAYLAPQLLEKHTVKVYAVRLIAAAIMIFSALQLSR